MFDLVDRFPQTQQGFGPKHVTVSGSISFSLASSTLPILPFKAINSFKMTDQARWKATVYVGGLAPIVTAANLEAAFLPFGEIADVSMP